MNKQKNTDKSKSLNKWFTLFRIIGIVIFIIVLFNVNLSEIWENFQKVSLFFLILGILSQVFLLMVKGIRWHLLNSEKNDREDIYQSIGEFLGKLCRWRDYSGTIG